MGVAAYVTIVEIVTNLPYDVTVRMRGWNELLYRDATSNALALVVKQVEGSPKVERLEGHQ
jgi:hypothetical protein